jgi:mRNA interferase RelE/StbE
MVSYSLLVKPSVEKDLRPLPKSVVKRVWVKIEALADDPTPSHSVKLAGAEALYRIRVGDYRVIYGVRPPLQADSHPLCPSQERRVPYPVGTSIKKAA